MDSSSKPLYISRKYLPVFLILVVLTIYSNSVQNSFHFDDYHSIVENPYIRYPENIPSFFTSPEMFSVDRNARMYRPLLLVTYTFNYWLGGYDVFGYHLVNIALHALNVILIYLILSTLLSLWRGNEGFYQGVPFLLALLFGVHAINTQAVNYISSRSVLLVTFFYLLAFYGYIKGTGRWYLLSILAYICALLSKEIGFTLPFVLIAYDFIFHKRFPVRRYLPFLAVAVWYLFLREMLFGVPIVEVSYKTLVEGKGMSRSMYVNLLTQIEALVFYMGKLILPVNLNVDHYFPVVRSPLEPSFIGSLLIVAFLLSFAIGIRKRAPIVSLGILWFFIAFLPETILPLNMIINEHRTYLPGIGFIIFLTGLAVTAAEASRQQRFRYLFPGAVFLLAGFILFNSFATYSRNKVWKDGYTLWSDVIKKNSLSFNANLEMGKYYLEKEDYEKAFLFARRTLKLAPGHPSTYHLLGLLYVKTGQTERGVKFLKRAIALRPSRPHAYLDLAFVYMDLGREDEAIKIFEKVANLNPFDDKANYNIGYLYMKKGQMQKAENYFLKAIKINPSNYPALYNLGGIYLFQGMLKNAEVYLKKALMLDKDDPDLNLNLGLLYERLGKREKAAEFFKKALELRPGWDLPQRKLKELKEGLPDTGRSSP